MRNLVINHFIYKKNDSTMKFAMKTVWEAWKSEVYDWKKLIKEDDIYPPDKMDIEPFLKITNPALTTSLLSSNDTTMKMAGEYLQNTRQYYDLFMDNKMNAAPKLTKLKAIQAYFKTLETFKSDILEHIQRTIEALEGLSEILQQQYSFTITGTSWFSTLVSENYFSKVM
jgi:hypothetical protein